ncbi:hypothetical protein B6D23_05555 [Gilliamella sp. N-W3]|nr:tail fiber protein [Gilliamella sp. N-W3]OTQ79499.1 hypothetical protein B6D23_05555 [Gilliamella sp. N-W3]
MHRIDTPTAQRDKFGERKNGFTRGNPQTGTPATQLDYLYCDAIQEEIANAIELAGIKLDKSKHNQLATAIKEFVSKGSVKLNSSTNSTSETEAATPLAVKRAYDLANGAIKKTGDTMTGQLILSKNGLKINYDNKNIMALITADDNYSHVFYDAEKNQWLSKLIYNSTTNTWKFQYIDDVTISGKSVLKNGDAIQTFGDLSTTINLNELTGLNEGTYYQGRNTSAVIERGYPIDQAGTLQVFKNGADGAGCCQIYTTYRNARQFIRNYRGGTKTWEEWSEVVTTANVNNYIPVGVPLPWPTNKPPAGWLECNGSWFDKNQFPKLATAYPSGSLPDLRGVFIRGKDNGRGLDPNRSILSYQDDAIRNIYGEISPISESFGASPIATGAFRYFEKHADHSPAHIDVGSVGGVTFDASRVVATANENRPRNIAFMYIVKAE